MKNHDEQTIKGWIFVTFVSLIVLAQLRKMVKAMEAKKRKHRSEHDMFRKVEAYVKIYFEGKYTDVYTTPTSAKRLVFDLLRDTTQHRKQRLTLSHEVKTWLQTDGDFSYDPFAHCSIRTVTLQSA